MEIDYGQLGKRIREFRVERHVSQVKLAEKVGIEPSNISHIERGTTKVSLGTLVKISNVLEVTLNDLLCDSILVERKAFEGQLIQAVKDCTPLELRIVTDAVKALVGILRSRGLENVSEACNHSSQKQHKECGSYYTCRFCDL